MFRKYVSFTLAILVINLAFGATLFASGSNDEKEAKVAEKVKTKIAKIGTGTGARVEVKLKDGTEIKGYVTEITGDSFTVMNEKTNSPAKIPYPQAKQAKSNSKKGLAIVGIVVGIVVIVALVVAGRN